MQLINKDKLPIVDSFIRMYGDLIKRIAGHYHRDIVFQRLRADENEYRDIMGRLGNVIYISEEEVGKMGLTEPEILASLAHEVGHVVYGTHNWHFDCEQRADSLAGDLGLGSQMISAIVKIIASRRYRNLTSMLVNRIYFLQNMLRG